MYEKIQKICEYLRKENENSENYIGKEIKEKYFIYKNWLIENGAIFDKNIDFPITYGPFHKIGIKSKLDLNENEAFILIPRSIIIFSEDLHYLDQYLKNIIDDISEEEISTIYLTLNLYLEKQNPDSFYKPYIDILFLNENNNYEWNDKTIFELNDEIAANSFENMVINIEELYNLIKQCEKFSQISKKEFKNCYFQVISKKIDLNDYNNSSALIPITDLLYQDNSMKVKYEIYDSENMVFKYTSIINDYKDSKINLYMTTSKYLPVKKPTYNKLIPFIDEDHNSENSDDSNSEDNKVIIKINNNDYFSLALSKNEKILKNKIICANHPLLSNKKILKNKGFCLLYNRNDYMNVKFNFNRGELLNDKYLEKIFGAGYQTRNDDPIYNTIKIKIEFDNICTDLLKYYRFMHFYEEKNAKEFFKYHFNLDLEIKIITLAIDFLKNKLKIMEINFSFDNDFKELENEIFNKKDANYFKTNIIIFRLSQKIILKNQIDLLNYILKIMIKYKKYISGYNSIFDFIEKEKYVNEYDKEEYTRMKILRFIAYMSKYIDLK